MLHRSRARKNANLDAVFHSLADPTRRSIVEQLTRGPASVSDLATPFDMTLSAIGQHIRLLESSGLVHTTKQGRVRTVSLRTDVLTAAEAWFADHRKRWELRLDRLGELLSETDD